MDVVSIASKSPALVHGVVDHAVEAPSRRSVCFADEADKFAVFADDEANEHVQEDDQDDDQEGEEEVADEEQAEDENGETCSDYEPSEDAGEEEQDAPSAAAGPQRRVQFCDDQSQESPVRAPEPSPYPRVAASSLSPLRKKFSPLQDRRVNAVLLEALQLVDFSSAELAVIDKAVKRLRDAVHGFAMLVDKQVNIIGVESLEERGRVRADIMDLCASLKTSNALLEGTSARMKKALRAGANQIHGHKRRLSSRAAQDVASASSPPRALRSGRSTMDKGAANGSPLSSRAPSSPYALSLDTSAPSAPGKMSPLQSPPLFSTGNSPTRVPFASLLGGGTSGASGRYGHSDPPLLPPEAFMAVLESVGLAESEFLDLKGVTRVLHEALAGLVARSSSLPFLGKAYHRNLLPQYASELARLATPSSPVVVPANTLVDYMSASPSRFDVLVQLLRVRNASVNSGARSSPSTSPKSRSPAAFFQPAAFMSSAAKAAADSFGVNPFAAQLTRNGGLMNGGQVVSLVVGRPADPELLESAEQTLTMAKLLHELATAECEARAGDRLSLRAPDARAKAFSRAYIAASKQLLDKEASGGFV